MKIIALLNFYDENPNWLAANVTACARLCDHIIASDGGYFLFPDAKPHSGLESHEAITQAAYAAGIGCTIHSPKDIFYGNEVEKRNQLVQLGMTVADHGDWFLRIDADELITTVPFDIRERLERSECYAAGVTLWWRSHLGPNAPADAQRDYDGNGHQNWMRFLIRAVPGLRVEGAHNFYLGEIDGRTEVLYGRADMHDEVPMEDCNDLRLEHRHVHRNRDRNLRADAFNLRRDQLGVERVWFPKVEHVDGGMVQL
jgi:hypothetical protein